MRSPGDELQTTLTVLAEAIGVIVSIIAGFGGIISRWRGHAGGRQIEGRTRVLTTAIVLETRQGNFDLALALGAILLAITFIINVVMLRLQGKTMDE